MDSEVSIKVMWYYPEKANLQEFNDAINFVTNTIEQTMHSFNTETATFDGKTGEPYVGLVFDPTTVDRISSVSVASLHAIAQIMSAAAEEDIDHGSILIEPILIDTTMIGESYGA